MVGKVGVEGIVDLFSPLHLLLRKVVVAPTKEEHVFHSESAESSAMIHAGGRSLMSITTRGHHTYTRLQLFKRKACGARPRGNTI